MKRQIIEAVPNFSEGRRMEVVDAITAAICAPGVQLLNRSSDWDHNRSVLTVAGPPTAVTEGLFQAVQVAAEQINLFDHEGQHPRVGAADVIPIVPIQHIELAECVTIARSLGKRIGEKLSLPVYLYEAAAIRPERRLLADVRRGEFEALLTDIEQPERKPDFGPPRIGPAGAAIVGARSFLIAFNVYLKCENVRIAKRISNKIRERDGGLIGVRALGLLVNGQAQVSMNLVDFSQTSLFSIVAEIGRLAELEGTEIDYSELIGMLPQQAVLDVAAQALQLPSLTPENIVENAISRGKLFDS